MNFIEYLSQFKICDSHLHICDLYKNELNLISNKNYFCSSSTNCKNDFLLQENLLKNNFSNVKKSFGIHPYWPKKNELYFLEYLLKENKINAIGEIGLDFYSKELKDKSKEQIDIFLIQVELAAKYNLPIIFHGRKSIDYIFKFSNELKKIPCIVFHSFAGTFLDAISILKKDIFGMFSFSKQIIASNKKSIDCIKKLPIENILLETDAPFQKLKGEDFSKMEDILLVYKKAFEIIFDKKLILCKNNNEFNDFVNQIYFNYSKTFCN